MRLLQLGESKKLLFLLAFYIIFTGSCKENLEKNNFNKIPTVSDSVPDYPYIIKSNNLEKMYDSAKWNLYLFSSRDTPKVILEFDTFYLKNPKPYLAYQLRFDSLYRNKDTFICFFDYYINDTLKLVDDSIGRYVEGIPHAVIFTDSITKKCVMFKTGDFIYECVSKIDGGEEKSDKEIEEFLSTKVGRENAAIFLRRYKKFYKPLNEDVLKFINAHQADLNPWFVDQAKKRGVIK